MDSVYGDWREGASTIPSLAADVHTAMFKDRLFAVWADGRFGGRDQIVISLSDDKGKTWTAPKILAVMQYPHPLGQFQKLPRSQQMLWILRSTLQTHLCRRVRFINQQPARPHRLHYLSKDLSLQKEERHHHVDTAFAKPCTQ